MKSILILLALLLCQPAASADQAPRALHPKSKSSKSKRSGKSGKRPNYHRPTYSKYKDDGGLMCLDLGSKGKHTLRVSSRLRAMTEFRHAKKGKCDRDERFKSNARYWTSYCREFNHKMVTIRAPEGLKKWMRDVVKAESGACKGEDEIIVIREV